MNIEELRSDIITMNNLKKTNDIYIFYYDETNNIRKLYINENHSFNSEPLVFALGGVLSNNKNTILNKQELRDILKIQSSANEIKRKHIVKGNFEEIIGSSKTKIFLKWLADNNLLIHFSIIDTLYFSIVDIIDSIVKPTDSTFQHINILKSDLLFVVRENLALITSIFHKYRYPSISNKDKITFLAELIIIVENNTSLAPLNKMMLKGVLQQGKKKRSLDFIEGKTKESLIDNFAYFYFHSLILFKKSTHIFDEETSVQNHFNSNNFFSTNLKRRTCFFKNSKDEFGIQISDIIIGIIGKMFSYLIISNNDDIMNLKKNLTQLEKDNLSLLNKLISNSEKLNPAFLHFVLSSYDKNKLSVLFDGTL